jgi:hypothetical protein
MMGLELIGVPRRYWVPVLFFVLPATILGVFIEALIEHGIVKYLEQKRLDTSERENA